MERRRNRANELIVALAVVAALALALAFAIVLSLSTSVNADGARNAEGEAAAIITVANATADAIRFARFTTGLVAVRVSACSTTLKPSQNRVWPRAVTLASG